MSEGSEFIDKLIVPDQEEWLAMGIRLGYCSRPFCMTHDGAPLSKAEMEDDEDMDMCICTVRLFDSPEHAREVSGE